MRIIHLFTIIALLLTLTACGHKPGKQGEQSPQASATDTRFNAYLRFKRITAKDDAQRQKLQEQYLEREALAAAVEKEPILDQELIAAELDEFRKEMLISRYFEKFLAEKVSDEAVQNYYGAHAADYEEKKVHVAHVLIRTTPQMSEEERKVKLTAAHEVYSQLQSGKDFAAIVEEYSEDKVSAKKGGDLGWLKEGSIDPRFSKTVFAMTAGALSEPIETQFGFHVVKLVEGAKVVKRPLEAVAGDIRYQLRNQARAAEMERLTGKARGKE